jgi:hypothetical protein
MTGKETGNRMERIEELIFDLFWDAKTGKEREAVTKRLRQSVMDAIVERCYTTQDEDKYLAIMFKPYR